MKTYGIVGQSPQHFTFGYDEEHPDCLAFKNILYDALDKICRQGSIRFYTDVSIGPPMWAAETLLTLQAIHENIELHCLIPYEEQTSKWPEIYRDRYYAIHEHCTSTHMLPVDKTAEDFFNSYAYMDQNCQHILAVIDPATMSENLLIQFLAHIAKDPDRLIIIDPTFHMAQY